MKPLIIALLFVTPALSAQVLTVDDVRHLIQDNETYKGSTISALMRWQVRTTDVEIKSAELVNTEKLIEQQRETVWWQRAFVAVAALGLFVSGATGLVVWALGRRSR